MSLNLPEGMDEDEFVEIVNVIANSLGDKFKFGYYDKEDIKQHCYLEAIDALDRYDGCRPLINFLWRHIRNRLVNLKRNKYFRLEKPCDKCPLSAYVKKEDRCTAYIKKTDCKLYNKWFMKNNSKQHIMNPIGISIVNSDNERNMKDNVDIPLDVANTEIINIIDANISVSMRKWWLQQKGGIKINKKYYDLLIAEIFTILEEHDIDVSQTW